MKLFADGYTVDIETLSLAFNAAVTSICIMPNDRSLSILDAMNNSLVYELEFVDGTHVSESTIDFHKKHDPDGLKAQAITCCAAGKIHISELPDLRFDKQRPELWGNGKDFDQVRLEASLLCANLDPADFWHYRQWQDLPTLIQRCSYAAHMKNYFRKHWNENYLHHPVYDCAMERILLLVCLDQLLGYPMPSVEGWEAKCKHTLDQINHAFYLYMQQFPSYAEVMDERQRYNTGEA